MKDPEKKIAIQLLTISMPTSYYSSPELWTVLVLKTVNLYLKYGNVGETYGYSCYGILLAASGDFKLGYEFGKLAVTISDKFKNKSEKCKGSNVFANLIHSWVYHIKNTVEINADGFNAGLESGEFQHASYTLMNASVNLFLWVKITPNAN